MKITGRWLHGESISGQILRLDEPLSFWGGLDPSTGEIIDQAHPQAGASMAGMDRIRLAIDRHVDWR